MAQAPRTKKTPATTGAGTAVATVDVNAKVAEMIASMQERLNKPGGDRIKTAGKVFELPDGRTSSDPLSIIIVDFVSANSLYEGRYDPNNIQPPVCFSIGKVIQNMVPSQSGEPQSDKCATCPMNQFGSDGNGKACKNTRLLAVLPEDFDEDTPLYTLAVSPTGIKGYDKFVTALATTKRMAPFQVVTEISFDETKDYPTLLFRALEPLDADRVNQVAAKLDEAEQRLFVEPDLTPREQPAKPAGRGGSRPAARTTAAKATPAKAGTAARRGAKA